MSHNALKRTLSGRQGFPGKGDILRHLQSGSQQPSHHGRETSRWKQEDFQNAQNAVDAEAFKNPEDGFQASSYTFLYLSPSTRVQPL